ncbi:MAG: hypothetical protein HQL24_07055 [Candidatus Omnitrophica bacterium]|nr:hypothetical protein [Candidatus Omnitrophota bacterium]
MLDVKSITRSVTKHFPHFGLNKKAQLVRLLYEIVQRDHKLIEDILNIKSARQQPFHKIKSDLLVKRFPQLTDDERARWHFTPLEVNPKYKVRITGHKPFIPKNIFIEKEVANSELVLSLKVRFPKAKYQMMSSYQRFIKEKRFDLSIYNRRTENLFIVTERYDFLCSCPCTNGAVGCGYYILNLGFGCGFECAYCFLQSYTNAPGIVLPSNIEDFFEAFKKLPNKNIRIGTGQFTDSLIFDSLTGYSTKLVDFFREYPQTLFEFKTKSDNVDELLSVKAANNIVVSWSVNPQNIIETTEFYTANLEERLSAALKCVQHGYKVGFHFDPIIFYDGWKKDYQNLVGEIFRRISAPKIAWISLGCLRMTPKQKEAIENRFPDNAILNGELILGFDNKLRYSERVREDIYKKMHNWIRGQSKTVLVYLCMESQPTERTKL